MPLIIDAKETLNTLKKHLNIIILSNIPESSSLMIELIY